MTRNSGQKLFILTEIGIPPKSPINKKFKILSDKFPIFLILGEIKGILIIGIEIFECIVIQIKSKLVYFFQN